MSCPSVPAHHVPKMAKNRRGKPNACACGSSVAFALTLLLLAYALVMPLWSGIMVFLHFDARIYEPQVVSGAPNAVAVGVGFLLNSLLTELTILAFPAAVFLLWGAAYSFAEIYFLVTPSALNLLNGTTEFRTVVLNPVFASDDGAAQQKAVAMLRAHVAVSVFYGVVGLVVGLVALASFCVFAPSFIMDRTSAQTYVGSFLSYQHISPRSVWITAWKLEESSLRDADADADADAESGAENEKEKPELEYWPFRVRMVSFVRDWTRMWHPTAVYAKTRTVLAWTFLGAMATELSLSYLSELRPNSMWMAGAYHAQAPMCFVVGVFATPLTPFARGSRRAYGRLGRHVFLAFLGVWAYIVSVFAYAHAEIDIDATAFFAGNNVLRTPAERCWGNYECFFQLCLGNVQTPPTTALYERSTNTSYRLARSTDCRAFADRSLKLWNAQLAMVVVGGAFLAAQLCHVYYLWRDTRRNTDILDEIETRRSRGLGLWAANNTWPPGLAWTKPKTS